MVDYDRDMAEDSSHKLARSEFHNESVEAQHPIQAYGGQGGTGSVGPVVGMSEVFTGHHVGGANGGGTYSVRNLEDTLEDGPRHPPEIFVFVGALKEIVEDLNIHFSNLRARLEPVSNSNKSIATSTAEPRGDRGTETPLGSELGLILDSLQDLRDRIRRTTSVLEI